MFLAVMMGSLLLAGMSAPMSETERQFAALTVLGWVLQMVKGPQKIPLWLAYVVVGIVASAIYIWLTPDFSLAPDLWRSSVAGFLMFLFAARGAGSTARDVKLAPATNSIT